MFKVMVMEERACNNQQRPSGSKIGTNTEARTKRTHIFAYFEKNGASKRAASAFDGFTLIESYIRYGRAHKSDAIRKTEGSI
ncbi:hypothetical protein D7M11_09485 [Paenibacillus ginsengarvi]|uniref:Uncharacterized protein n=1 Tax=Paenibacillus ginsengarvi TaxID=400777 RepID=A0A3B0CLR5_9BACL|nr:hypothetical protein D7M11_09485 [Paenibacillus ginsengarvi]